jgi:hypothetical protein
LSVFGIGSTFGVESDAKICSECLEIMMSLQESTLTLRKLQRAAGSERPRERFGVLTGV